MSGLALASWLRPGIMACHMEKKGKGLFTMIAISQGEKAVVFGGRIVTESLFHQAPDNNFIKHGFQVEQDLYILPAHPDFTRMDPAFYLNHSCEPNLGLCGQITFVALRDICAGEHLTFDYAMTDSFDSRFDCLVNLFTNDKSKFI